MKFEIGTKVIVNGGDYKNVEAIVVGYRYFGSEVAKIQFDDGKVSFMNVDALTSIVNLKGEEPTLEEFVLMMYPEIVPIYKRYLNRNTIHPIGTEVITLRSGFGGGAGSYRTITGYYTSNYKDTKDPSKAIAYRLTNKGAPEYLSHSISEFKNAWNDFIVLSEVKDQL